MDDLLMFTAGVVIVAVWISGICAGMWLIKNRDDLYDAAAVFSLIVLTVPMLIWGMGYIIAGV